MVVTIEQNETSREVSIHWNVIGHRLRTQNVVRGCYCNGSRSDQSIVSDGGKGTLPIAVK